MSTPPRLEKPFVHLPLSSPTFHWLSISISLFVRFFGFKSHRSLEKLGFAKPAQLEGIRACQERHFVNHVKLAALLLRTSGHPSENHCICIHTMADGTETGNPYISRNSQVNIENHLCKSSHQTILCFCCKSYVFDCFEILCPKGVFNSHSGGNDGMPTMWPR